MQEEATEKDVVKCFYSFTHFSPNLRRLLFEHVPLVSEDLAWVGLQQKHGGKAPVVDRTSDTLSPIHKKPTARWVG